MTPSFELKANVHENVEELRRVLGSVTRPISRADLATLLNQRDPSRQRNATTVRRWELERVEPDYDSVGIMADLAGVGFESFARGARAAAGLATGAPTPYHGPKERVERPAASEAISPPTRRKVSGR